MIIILMGVSGSGKTTIGLELSRQVGWQLYDGDDFHPPANVEKMRRGEPLSDDDRAPWLESLHAKIVHAAEVGESCILACSALTQRSRAVLSAGVSEVLFIHLTAPQSVIADRQSRRQHRYMPPSLLQSQFDALEPASEALEIDVSGDLAATVAAIRSVLEKKC